MEWRQQTSVSCAQAFIEAQRWIEQVTGKSFGCKDFRAALENGVLLCDLINQLRPGIIKRVNRLSTPIAGLDNVSVFLKGCEKLGLNGSQLFHPGDLQDPSSRVAFRRDENSRRLKNVLITIYWLGRKAQLDSLYSGPPLNLKAFQGLLGLALTKVLDDGSNVSVRDSRSKEYNSLEREESLHSSLGYKRENSVDSVESLDSRTVQQSSEGCGSDAEAEQVFRMERMQSSLNHTKSVTDPQLILQRQQGQKHSGNTCGSPLSSKNLVKVRHERAGQVNPGWIWSKSLSDIRMVYPARKVSNELPNPYKGQDVELARAWIQESIGKDNVAAKDSEVKWQDVDDEDQESFLINEKVESSTTNSSFKKQTSSVYLHSQHLTSVRQRKANQARQTFARQGKEVNGASYFRSASFQTSNSSHQSFVQNHPMPQPFSSQQLRHSESQSLPSTASPEYHKVDHSDMRVSLTLQPNDVPDFGFHTHWDNTGARVKFILPGSPAEICHLCVDDEIVSVNGVFVAQMNYSQWKDTLAAALETGGLTMDIRRYGNKGWITNERNEPIQPSQKQKSINVSTSAIVCPYQPVDTGEMKPLKVSECNGSKNDAEVKSGVNSDYASIARSKEFGITKQNQTRRAEFFKSKGGSESAISDLQVPSISSTSSNWSWDREEERRRQEKWQEEQERLLQEQYQRDQERLHAEWQKAQQEVMEVRNPEMPFKPASSGQSLVINQLGVNGEVEDRAQIKASEENPQCNADHTHANSNPETDWAVSSCGMTQLSPAHRIKSFSTSVLADSQQQARADQRKSKGQTLSKAEQDRQRILQEMKKRHQLLTDNSWIRRRSSSLYKDPVYVGVPMKRYESLDNLDTWRGSPITSTSFSYSRPHSAAAGFCAPSRNSCSRYITGSTLSHKSTATKSPPQDGVWCTQPVTQHCTGD